MDENEKNRAVLEPLFESAGERLAVSGRNPWIASGKNAVWLVTGGSVDVFSVHVEKGRPAGVRKHMFRVEQGELVLGQDIAADFSGQAVLAVGFGNSEVIRCEREGLAPVFGVPEQAEELIRQVGQWIKSLSTASVSQNKPEDAPPVKVAGRFEMPESSVVDLPQGMCCLKVESGRLLFNSEPDIELTSSSGWFPLGFGSWAQSVDKSVVSACRFSDRTSGEEIWKIVDTFHSAAMKCLSLRAGRWEASERDRVDAREDIIQQSFSASLDRQAGILDARADETRFMDQHKDDVFAACSEVGRYMGVPFKQPVSGGGNEEASSCIMSIARASRVRVRSVTLDHEWWKKDNGPLLGFMGNERHPVAIIPARGHRYRVVDPATRRTIRVTSELAADISRDAYMFYRPLPERPLSGSDVLSFALKDCGGDFLMIALMGIMGGLIGLVVPMMTKVIFDTLIPRGAAEQLLEMSAGLVVAAIAATVFGLTRSLAMLRIEGRGDSALQAAVWSRILSLPASFFRGFSAGDLATRTLGINAIRKMLSGTVTSSLLSAVFSIFNLALIFYYSWKLAVLAVILVLAALLVSYMFARTQLKHLRASSNAHGRLTGLVFQLLHGISRLRIAGAEARAFSLWSDGFLNKKRHDIKAAQLSNGDTTFKFVYPLFCTLATFAVYYFFLKKSLTTGEFLAFSAAFSQFLAAVLGMSGSLVALVKIRPVFERVKPLLEAVPEVDDDKVDPGKLDGRIDISHVAFRYAPDAPLILKDLSVTIEPGQFVAFVGPSGAGKSTLFRLMLGFDVPEAGEIYYDGQDIRKLDLCALRRQASVVLQNGRVFSGDIYQNIIGSGNLTLEDAWAAAAAAGLDEDIRRMPMGMHTFLPEGGTTLSGGQRQRLMIARAFVRRPAILFFDEATSALDNVTQAKVMKSMEQLKTTCVVIAQRLSTVKHADKICVLMDGGIAQEGSFDELINVSGPFQDLCKRQMT